MGSAIAALAIFLATILTSPITFLSTNSPHFWLARDDVGEFESHAVEERWDFLESRRLVLGLGVDRVD